MQKQFTVHECIMEDINLIIIMIIALLTYCAVYNILITIYDK